MKLFNIILSLTLFVACTFAQQPADIVGPGCRSSYNTVARTGGSYPTSDNGVAQIYDITITNSGICNVDIILINLYIPPVSGNVQSGIIQQWNIITQPLSYSVTVSGTLLPGQSTSCGVIVEYPNSTVVPAGFAVREYATACPKDCVNAQYTTSTGAGSASTTSSIPSSTTTGSSNSGTSITVGPGSATLALTARVGGSFQSGTGMSQIFDLLVSSVGTCGVTSLDIKFAFPSGSSITSSWNLTPVDSVSNDFYLTNFGGTIQPGQSASAGIIVFFPNTASIDTTSVSASFGGGLDYYCS